MTGFGQTATNRRCVCVRTTATASARVQAPEPHPDIGDWWALYDYGPEVVGRWEKGHRPPYPEEAKRARDREAAAEARRRKREARRVFYETLEANGGSCSGGEGA